MLKDWTSKTVQKWLKCMDLLVLDIGDNCTNFQPSVICKFFDGDELMRCFVKLHLDLFYDVPTISFTSAGDPLNVLRVYANSFWFFHTISILYPYFIYALFMPSNLGVLGVE